MSAAQSGPDDLDKYLAAYVYGSEESYQAAVGAERLAALAPWSAIHRRLAGAIDELDHR